MADNDAGGDIEQCMQPPPTLVGRGGIQCINAILLPGSLFNAIYDIWSTIKFGTVTPTGASASCPILQFQ